MALVEMCVRFARKPLREKRMALTETLRSAPADILRGVANRKAFIKRLRSAFVHARAEGLEFRSGLGDSANLLYAFVRSLKPEVCVEIGSARGKSACFIGMALKENGCGRLFAIDPHKPTEWNDPNSVESLPALRANLSTLGLRGQVEIMRATSQEAAENWEMPIDLLFIDGDHTYEGVKRDWELFVPFVRPFGIVVFHDTMWAFPPYRERDYARTDLGVPRFVDELRRDGFPTITMDKDFGFTLVQPTRGGVPLLTEPPSRPSVAQESSDVSVPMRTNCG